MPGGGYAVPGPTSFYEGPSAGCLGSATFGLPTPVPSGGFEYPTITPPGLPMGPGFSGDRATPTPAPPPSVSEDRSFRPSTGSSRGSITIKLPADAKLYAEGRPLTVSNGEKTFQTPPLLADRDAIYTFRVEYIRNGETVTQTKKVTIRAGGKATLVFDDLLARSNRPDLMAEPVAPTLPTLPTIKPPETFSASNSPATTNTLPATRPAGLIPEDRAKITVTIPAGAVLYVDGKRNERGERVREFTTPVLKPGVEYAYQMKVEIAQNGKKQFQELRVPFQGGMSVNVDFTRGDAPYRSEVASRIEAGK